MKRMLIVASAVAILLGIGTVGAQEAQAVVKTAEAPVVKRQTHCPIMVGNLVSTNIYVDAEGKRVYFCCNGCPPRIQEGSDKIYRPNGKGRDHAGQGPSGRPGEKTGNASRGHPGPVNRRPTIAKSGEANEDTKMACVGVAAGLGDGKRRG